MHRNRIDSVSIKSRHDGTRGKVVGAGKARLESERVLARINVYLGQTIAR